MDIKHIKVSKELHKRLKLEAVRQGISLGKLLEKLAKKIK